MADRIWDVNDRAYVILEHFAENSEEKELAEYGMLLWGNLNYNYNEATMGYITGSNFSGVSYKARGWDVPHLVAYMESHDEERLMYKNLRWGNSTAGYDTRDMKTALERMELAAVFYFTIPGPKMIWQFGELGYDYSINHCPDGTIDEACRTARKPVRWDYYDQAERKKLFDIYSLLIELKTTQPVFATDNFTTSLAGAMKTIHLNHPENYVTVLGNFNVTPGTINPRFQQEGTWYEFFTGERIQVEDVNAGILLQPGEYRLYSTVELPGHGTPPPVNGDDFSVRVYPNPSQGRFTVDYQVAQKEKVGITIYNIKGQKVLALPGRMQEAGSYSVDLELPPGIFILQVTAGDQESVSRIVIF
jgi:hypothetical protein